MGLFDNGMRVGSGIALGVGALILAPAVFPAVASVLKPLIKATIKGGIILIEKGREIAAETMEVVEDLTAEAKAELAQERAHAGAAITPDEGIM